MAVKQATRNLKTANEVSAYYLGIIQDLERRIKACTTPDQAESKEWMEGRLKWTLRLLDEERANVAKARETLSLNAEWVMAEKKLADAVLTEKIKLNYQTNS